MTWGRIDDQLDDDERFWLCPMASIGLYWSALPRCLRRDENFIPDAQLRQMCYRNQEDPVIEPLVRCGLWVKCDGGYTFNEDDWQQMRIPEEKRQRISQTRSEVGKAGAAARWKNGEQMPKVKQTDGKPMANDAPVPGPVPGIEVTNVTSHPVSTGSVGKNSPAKAQEEAVVSGFFETWNSRCSPLPRMRKLPVGKARSLVIRACKYADDDIGLIGEAIAIVAKNDGYREKGYGFVSFCRNVETWVDAASQIVDAARVRAEEAQKAELIKQALEEEKRAKAEERDKLLQRQATCQHEFSQTVSGNWMTTQCVKCDFAKVGQVPRLEVLSR